MKRPNVYLVGFMGTGKTTIGRELARGMGRKFIDVDHEVERRHGMSVSEIFASKGEAAFRASEEEVALELSRANNRVIASGGGSILNPNILHAFQETGTLICLYTQRDDLVDRLSRTDKRPLLRGKSHDEVAETVETLMERRDAVYRQVKIRIDTTHLTPMSAAGRIQELLASQARAIKYLDDFVDLS